MTVAFRKFQAVGEIALTVVNGRPGVVLTVGGQPFEVATVALDPSGESVAAVFAVLNPDKLALWSSDPVGPKGANPWKPD